MKQSDQTNKPHVLNTVNHVFNLGPPCLWILLEGNIYRGILNVAPDLCRMLCTFLYFVILKVASDYLGFIFHCSQSEVSLRIKVNFYHHYSYKPFDILSLYFISAVNGKNCTWPFEFTVSDVRFLITISKISWQWGDGSTFMVFTGCILHREGLMSPYSVSKMLFYM